MPAYLSTRNEVATDSLFDIQLLPNTVLAAGNLNNLRTRNLARGVYINAASSPLLDEEDAPGVRLRWIAPAGLGNPFASSFGARVIGILGMPLWEQFSPLEAVTISVWGNRTPSDPDPVLLGTVRPYRLRGIDGPSPLLTSSFLTPSRVNRFVVVPEELVAAYGSIDVRVHYVNYNGLPPHNGCYIGGIWVGNAVVIPDGVEAQFSITTEPGATPVISRGGQSYMDADPPVRSVEYAIGNLDERQCWGSGVSDGFGNGGIRLQPEWWSDIQRRVSTGSPCICIPRTREVPGALEKFWLLNTAMYGRLSRPINIEHQAGPYYRASWGVVEER